MDADDLKTLIPQLVPFNGVRPLFSNPMWCLAFHRKIAVFGKSSHAMHYPFSPMSRRKVMTKDYVLVEHCRIARFGRDWCESKSSSREKLTAATALPLIGMSIT
jgi:hypothetical protein